MAANATQIDAFADFDQTADPPRIMTGDDLVIEGSAGSWATFSRDRQYRYLLCRMWEPLAPILVVGMLNPSKAGGLKPDGKPDNDPTVTRCLGFARRDRYGGLLIWNAHAFIATDPRELKAAEDPQGPRNRDAIGAALGAPTLARAVIAWGRPATAAIKRSLRSAYVNAAWRRRLYRFGDPTKDGWPRHPLYLRSDTPIVRLSGHP
jgi:hypothetical protein